MTDERMTRIDLHMHSNVSDGTDTPLQLLERAAKQGLALFSLTDHDALAGCLEIGEALEKARREEGEPGPLPRFITGVEFSCEDEEGKYHILGYGYDPASPGIRETVRKGHDLRMRKLSLRLDFLKDRFGFAFSDEDRAQLSAMPNPGKPHIGNLMVRYGYAETKREAIDVYLNQLRLENEYIRPEEAIAGIRAGGGVPVLAHPSYGSGDQLITGGDMRARIEKLMSFGLQGLEAYYSGFTSKLQEELLGFAAQYGLFVTAGSDYHGENKLVEMGDTNLAGLEDGCPGIRNFVKKMMNRPAVQTRGADDGNDRHQQTRGADDGNDRHQQTRGADDGQDKHQ